MSGSSIGSRDGFLGQVCAKRFNRCSQYFDNARRSGSRRRRGSRQFADPAPPKDESPLCARLSVATTAVAGGRMRGGVSDAPASGVGMSRAAVAAALSGAVASSDPCVIGVGAARTVSLAAGATTAADSAMTAVPSVKAIAAAPAEPAAVGVAAPIEARASPTVIVPAEIAAAEDELDPFQRRRVAGSIDCKDHL